MAHWWKVVLRTGASLCRCPKAQTDSGIFWKQKLWYSSPNITCFTRLDPRDFFLFALLKYNVWASRYSVQCRFSVSTGWAQKSIHISSQSLYFKTRTWISVKGEHTTGWIKRNMDKSYYAPCRTPVPQLNERPLYTSWAPLGWSQIVSLVMLRKYH